MLVPAQSLAPPLSNVLEEHDLGSGPQLLPEEGTDEGTDSSSSVYQFDVAEPFQHQDAEHTASTFANAGSGEDECQSEQPMHGSAATSTDSGNSTALEFGDWVRQSSSGTALGAPEVEVVAPNALTVFAAPSLLPDEQLASFDILNYYFVHTAVDMANGSTEDNPFLSQLIPLAMSSELVLSLILAQSLAHYEAKDRPNTSLASHHYFKSLKLLQKHINYYVQGNTDYLLDLTTGTLMMCLTEVRISKHCQV